MTPNDQRALKDGFGGTNYDSALRYCFLAFTFLCLAGQVVYDRHATTALAIFPEWLLLGCLWYSWRRGSASPDQRYGLWLLALLIPIASALTLLIAWQGWKANSLAIGGVIPVSDSASYYISAETFLREAFLDVSGQRRPLNMMTTSVWLFLSQDSFKTSLLIQALAFSGAAFLASTVIASLHGIRAGLVFFALLLVFTEPYMPTMLSETNGVIFGTLALVAFLHAMFRKSPGAYGAGAFLLATALAIRPSAMLVLPCLVIAGTIIFRTTRVRTILLAAILSAVVLLPSVISLTLNKTMSHGDGALNANLSYTVYGLVSGGTGWEQYRKDNPHALDGLSEAEQSRLIMEAAKQHFKQHPFDLVRGLLKGQLLGPLQSFAQLTRLAFLGASGDPLKIIPSAAIGVVSVLFAGVVALQLRRRGRAVSLDRDARLFFALFMLGYLTSIPFFYKDGGLRLHAAVFPLLAYLLLLALIPGIGTRASNLAERSARRLLASAAAFATVLLVLVGSIALLHPKGRAFPPLPTASGQRGMAFRFQPGWPQADLRLFPARLGDKRQRWFSGAIPDDDYRSAGIREISGHGRLYFGFDEGARIWKIILTEQPLGLVNDVQTLPDTRDGRYRDFYAAAKIEALPAQ